MKDAVKAAVSSAKWHAPYSETNGDSLSDVGDDEVTTTGMRMKFIRRMKFIKYKERERETIRRRKNDRSLSFV